MLSTWQSRAGGMIANRVLLSSLSSGLLLWFGGQRQGVVSSILLLPRPTYSFILLHSDSNDDADLLPLEVRPKPCAFLAPVVGGPLSTEFLEAIGNTEAEVREIIKEESTEEDAKLALRTVPAFVKTEASPTGIPSASAAHPNHRAQQVKGEPVSPVNTTVLGKRKNDEPEATASKFGRGNNGQRVPPGSRDTNRTREQWGAPLSAKDHQVMNIGLMTDIWTNRISPRHMSDYGGGLFEVRFPSDKAWALLGKDIRSVFKLISSEWRPIRLHTRASGAFMCVGLWVRTGQTQGQKAEVMRHTLPELYRLLRRWSLQAQGSGQAESLADFLTDYLGA